MSKDPLTPEPPSGKVFDLYFRWEEEVARWQIVPDHSSRRWEGGKEVVDYSWLTYTPPSALGTDEATARYERYRVKTSLAARIVKTKALEAALEKY